MVTPGGRLPGCRSAHAHEAATGRSKEEDSGHGAESHVCPPRVAAADAEEARSPDVARGGEQHEKAGCQVQPRGLSRLWHLLFRITLFKAACCETPPRWGTNYPASWRREGTEWPPRSEIAAR